MTLVQNTNKPKSIRQEVKDIRRAYVVKYDTAVILSDLAWKHRVGLLMSGYPAIMLGALTWFVAIN